MKQILLLFMLFLPLSTFAQLTYDVKAGVNLSHFKSSQETDLKQVGGMKAGFQAGVDINYEFERHWVLSAGLTFARTNSTMNLTDGMSVGYFFPETEVRLNHFMIPLRLGYNIRFSKNFHLMPSVGWYGSIDFSAGESSLGIMGENGLAYTKWKPTKGFSYQPPVGSGPVPYTATLAPFRNWTYGLVGGVKAVLWQHYTVSVDYYEAIKKAQKQNDLRNYGLQMSVGYRF